MKQLFKTTLLATAVAVTCGTAYAGTVAVNKQVHSIEGLAGVTATQISNDITYTLAATYRQGDKITFTVSAGELTKNLPAVVIIDPVNDPVEANAIAGLTLGLLNSDATSVTYRVTALTPANNGATPTAVEWQNVSTVGAVFGGDDDKLAIEYSPATVAANDITVSVTSQTATGDVLDNTGTRTATIAEAKTQFGSAAIATKFNAIVDVAQARKSFTSGLTDSMAFTVANPTTTSWMNLATVNTSTVSLFGEPGKMTGVKASNWATGGTKTFDEAAAKLSVSYTGMTTNDTFTFTAPAATASDALTLEAQKFTTDVVYNYSSNAGTAGIKTIVTGLDSGEWTLNGATVNIPYMPYSPNASQIMYVSNEGTQAGDVLVTAFDEKGNTWDLGKVGVANAKTVTKLAPLIGQALAAKGFTAGKLSITITVNAPSDDITVFASYNSGSLRGYVNTDEYKGK